MCKKAPKRFANFWCLFLCFDPHLNTVQPPQLVKATSPQRPLFFVPADSPFIYSRLNLSTTATATTACPQLPNYPLRGRLPRPGPSYCHMIIYYVYPKPLQQPLDIKAGQ